MRIIAGKHRGRSIETPPGRDVRPTSDFAREGIFNLLVHGRVAGGHSAVEGRRVADLFCGTGALGLEALSRGAAHVTFIDQSREALELARKNAQRFGELNRVDFMAQDALQLPRAGAPCGLLFLDPPYGQGLLAPTLVRLRGQGWLDNEALIVTERDERDALSLPEGFTTLDERRYGRALVAVLQA